MDKRINLKEKVKLFTYFIVVAQTVKKIFLEYRRHRFDPWVRKIPYIRKWKLTLVFLPGEFHGQRSLVVYSSWGHKESDMTELLNSITHVFYVSLFIVLSLGHV